MAKYGKAASKSVKRAMHKKKRGTLKSGRSGKTVKSRKQAIAIGLSGSERAPKCRKRSRRRRSLAESVSGSKFQVPGLLIAH